jgi:hypothetical protein
MFQYLSSFMKKILLTSLYTLIIAVIGWVLYVIFASNISNYFYGYETNIYKRDIDFLFSEPTLKILKVKNTYRSGLLGSVYFLKADSLSNSVIIETTNFQNIYFSMTKPIGTNKIDLSDFKEYTTFFDTNYPVIQTVLNPRKSEYLVISLEKPFEIVSKIRKEQLFYLKGNYRFVSFGNSQNCFIVSFPEKYNNEILVIKEKGKLYFLVHSIIDKSLLDIINPVYL